MLEYTLLAIFTKHSLFPGLKVQLSLSCIFSIFSGSYNFKITDLSLHLFSIYPTLPPPVAIIQIKPKGLVYPNIAVIFRR